MSDARYSTATSHHTERAATHSVSRYLSLYEDPDGARITIRAMVRADRDAVLAFFRGIPGDERIYLSEDVASPDVVTRWAERMDYHRALPLLATIGNVVIGVATLHHDASPACEHIRAVRIVVDPAHRNKGLGRFLLKKLVDIAKSDDRELEKVVLEVVADTERAAQRAARAVGFAPVHTLSAYVRYYDGKPHDVILMELPVWDHAPAEMDEPAEHMF